MITSLDGLLRRAAARWGEQPLFVGSGPFLDDGVLDSQPTESYAAFNTRVDGLAAGLAERGVSAGSRVGAVLTDPRDLAWAWFAAARLGAVLAPLNPALTPSELRPAFQTVGFGTCLTDAGTADAVRAAGETDPWDLGDIDRPGASLEPRPVGAGCALSVLSTSGTTGRPKGCVLTHASYVVPALDFGEWMNVAPQDRFFCCLPLFHLAGQAFVAVAVARGASVVLARRFSGSRFWDQVVGTGATLFRHLGEMLAVLCAQDTRPAERRHRLRTVYGGGASASVVDRFERRFGTPVIEGYGLTETNTVLRNDLRSRRPGSIGRPPPYAEVRIADEHGGERRPTEVGEIQVRRNPVMMSGYLGDPHATSQSFVGDWYRTGDLGWQDPDGWFFYAGRTKDLIRRRGENIRAGEIEEVLHAHPDVAAAAVVSVADELGGEECKAFVVGARPGAVSVDDVLRWCRASLADFKVPRYVEVCDRLPRTPTNKIDKSALRAVGALGTCTDRLAAEATP